MSFLSRLGALLGVSAYQPPVLTAGPSLGDPSVERARQAYGGQLQGRLQSHTRWYLSDLEAAEIQANNGQLQLAAQLARAAMGDGVIAGTMGTRTHGLLHLPRRFRGPAKIVADLQAGGDEYTRSIFDEMFPSVELAKMLEDGLWLGIAVGELQPVPGRDFPVLCHLDPQFLQFRLSENRWYFNSIAGPLPVTPGDGRWVLHVPGGRTYPWRQGLYRSVGAAWIRKQHALQAKSNFEDSLANAAKVIKNPQAAADEAKRAMLQEVSHWGLDNTFMLPSGWEIDLLEAGSQGWECFSRTVEEQDRQSIIAIAGQTPTTDGGAGFSNIDVHKAIKNDFTRNDGAGLAYTLNTQALPYFVLNRYGEQAFAQGTTVEYEVTPPLDRQREAQALSATATAIAQLQTTAAQLQASGVQVDYRELCLRAGIPLLGDPNAAGDDDIDIDLDADEPPAPQGHLWRQVMTQRHKYEPRGLLALDPQAFGLEFDSPAIEAPQPSPVVAVVRVWGPLEHHRHPVLDSYDSLLDRIEAVVASPATTVLMVIDSPGGVVSGLFETATLIRDLVAESGKTLVAYVEGQCCSAAYALACVASRIVISSTSLVGSVDVLDTRVDLTGADAQAGVKFTFFSAGRAKAYGHPHLALSDGELADRKRIVDAQAKVFFDHVKATRGLDPQPFEARVYSGQEAVSVGLADRVSTYVDLIRELTSPDQVRELTGASPTGVAAMATISEARKALQAIADGDNEEEAKLAQAALNALSAESESDEDKDKEEKDSEAEKKDEETEARAKATSMVSVSTAGDLAATVQTLSAQVAQLTSLHEATERTALLASRPDVSKDLLKVLKNKPVPEVKEILNAIPRKASQLAASTVVAATRGEGQGTPSDLSSDPELADVDRAMGFGLTPTLKCERRGNTVYMGRAPSNTERKA
jgi:ClpP class serine protease